MSDPTQDQPDSSQEFVKPDNPYVQPCRNGCGGQIYTALVTSNGEQKWKPIDASTDKIHLCPNAGFGKTTESSGDLVVPCRNQCGTRIKFDSAIRGQNGKVIPLDFQNGEPHLCSNRLVVPPLIRKKRDRI